MLRSTPLPMHFSAGYPGPCSRAVTHEAGERPGARRVPPGALNRKGVDMNTEYAYDDNWKAAVDRSGDEWRQYLEARYFVTRFIRTRHDRSEDVAESELKDTEEHICGAGPHGHTRWLALVEIMREIYRGEGKQIAQNVLG